MRRRTVRLAAAALAAVALLLSGAGSCGSSDAPGPVDGSNLPGSGTSY